jgi:S1-C subfamily serine protease
VAVEGRVYTLGGDVIISVNGSRMINLDALASYLDKNARPGNTVVLGIMRGTSFLSIPVIVGSLPPPPRATG